jgi:hypothetical protein
VQNKEKSEGELYTNRDSLIITYQLQASNTQEKGIANLSKVINRNLIKEKYCKCERMPSYIVNDNSKHLLFQY